jgi:hypothetical protein
MVNDHVGPKGNRLKVWESPLGNYLPENWLHGLEEADWSDMSSKSSQQEIMTILTWSIRLLESHLSAGGNESRDAGVTDKHSFSVSYPEFG